MMICFRRNRLDFKFAVGRSLGAAITISAVSAAASHRPTILFWLHGNRHMLLLQRQQLLHDGRGRAAALLQGVVDRGAGLAEGGSVHLAHELGAVLVLRRGAALILVADAERLVVFAHFIRLVEQGVPLTVAQPLERGV